MLGWLTGLSRPSEDQAASPGGEKHCIQDHPETPAPQFALRALKSAFLGTSHIKQNNPSRKDEQSVTETCSTNSLEKIKILRAFKVEPPSSPTKGILVTPGTAASKRKTVSFGSLIPNDGDGASSLFLEEPLTSKTAMTDLRRSVVLEETCPQEKKATLTKSRFEAQLEDSKRRISKKSALQSLENRTTISSGHASNAGTAVQTDTSAPGLDATVDLNVPCSTSGKHWKGEYEQYHRKSNRELKRVIQHGQTIRSYAQRKDSEATSLGEKLNNELAKVATMEARVSELASELTNVRAHSTSDQSNSIDIVNELAKQTALAIQYKQKADRYKAALDKRAHNSSVSDQAGDCIQISLDNTHATRDSDDQDMISLRKDLEKLRLAVGTAEEKSTRVQHENTMLKQKMARVKEEMKNYEVRRLAREERLRKRETKLRLVKESCEVKLAKLTIEHQEMLRMHSDGQHVYSSDALPTRTRTVATQNFINRGERATTPKTFQESHAALASRAAVRGRIEPCNEIHEAASTGRPRSPLFLSNRPSPDRGTIQKTEMKQSPRATLAKVQESSIDLWKHGIQENLVDATLPIPEIPEDSGFSLLQRGTHDALQELDQNTIQDHQSPSQCSPTTNALPEINTAQRLPEPPSHEPALSSAVRRMQSRRSTIASPRPTLLGFAPSPMNPDIREGVLDFSNGWNERPSTMGSKVGRLPPDRVEAARKRLEARKGGKRSKLENNA